MTDPGISALQPVRRSAKHFQVQDFAWLLFCAALIATAPERNYNALILVPLIAAFQIVEPRMKVFGSRRGQIVSTALKLILSYLLVGWTHGSASSYYSIFLIPVISAATLFELPGVISVIAIAAIAYLSFLSPQFLDYGSLQDSRVYLSEVSLRACFFAIIGFLVYQQAHAKRKEMQRTQDAVFRLEAANRDLREAQASLRRSERLAALGQLTAGLAHELRNPLGTIKASAEMLTKPATKNRPEVMNEMAGFITSEVDRINGLVGSFLDFARPLQVHPTMSNIGSLLEEVRREQSELALGCEVSVIIKTDSNPLKFEFDRDLLRIALSNLVQNAIQASVPGQQVEVQARARDENVLLAIKDHGSGIDPQHLESIFNPFFTTKPRGTGLGLALVAKIVDEHGGRIHVESQPGRGTRFEVTLPKDGFGPKEERKSV